MLNEINIKYNSIQQEYMDLETDFNEKVNLFKLMKLKKLEWLIKK